MICNRLYLLYPCCNFLLYYCFLLQVNSVCFPLLESFFFFFSLFSEAVAWPVDSTLHSLLHALLGTVLMTPLLNYYIFKENTFDQSCNWPGIWFHFHSASLYLSCSNPLNILHVECHILFFWFTLSLSNASFSCCSTIGGFFLTIYLKFMRVAANVLICNTVELCFRVLCTKVLEYGALCYKQEGLEFHSWRAHSVFQLTQSFQPHYIPGVESASNRNEYQESS
jgi:hypothetical protein